MARADGSLRSVLTRHSRIDVLVIDDWAMAPRLSHVAFDWGRLLQVFRCQRVGVHEVGIAAFEYS